MKTLLLFTVFVGVCGLAVSGRAATMAFGGEIVRVEATPTKDKEGLMRFGVRIDYYDYCSRGKFGRKCLRRLPKLAACSQPC